VLLRANFVRGDVAEVFQLVCFKLGSEKDNFKLHLMLE
jgi:hypothetical protein